MFRRKGIVYKGFIDYYAPIKKYLFWSLVVLAIALLWGLWFVFNYYSYNVKSNIYGSVFYGDRPVFGVAIIIDGEPYMSDENGEFVANNISFGKKIIKVEKMGFGSLEESIFVWKNKHSIDPIQITRDENFSASFSGIVLDGFDHKPVLGAIINLGKSTTISNARGEFAFYDMPKENALIHISAPGFKDVSGEINMTLVEDGTTPFYLTPFGQISFSSARDGRKAIYTMNYDGKNLNKVTKEIKADFWNAKFVPGQNKMIFYSNMGDEVDIWGTKISRLYVLNIQDGKMQKLGRDEIIPEGDFRISKDGKSVVFLGKEQNSDKREIYLSGLGQEDLWVQLTDNNLLESNIDISPDGKQIAFGVFVEGERVVYLLNIDDRSVKKVNTFQDRESAILFSPDGSKLLYLVRSMDFNNRIYAYKLEEDSLEEIYKSSSSIKNVAWGMNGEKIVFTSERDERNDIYVINSDGKNETKLTSESGNYYNLLWPDEMGVLFFISAEKDGNKLAIMDISTRKINKTEFVADDIFSWNPELLTR